MKRSYSLKIFTSRSIPVLYVGPGFLFAIAIVFALKIPLETFLLGLLYIFINLYLFSTVRRKMKRVSGIFECLYVDYPRPTFGDLIGLIFQPLMITFILYVISSPIRRISLEVGWATNISWFVGALMLTCVIFLQALPGILNTSYCLREDGIRLDFGWDQMFISYSDILSIDDMSKKRIIFTDRFGLYPFDVTTPIVRLSRVVELKIFQRSISESFNFYLTPTCPVDFVDRVRSFLARSSQQ